MYLSLKYLDTLNSLDDGIFKILSTPLKLCLTSFDLIKIASHSISLIFIFYINHNIFIVKFFLRTVSGVLIVYKTFNFLLIIL